MRNPTPLWKSVTRAQLCYALRRTMQYSILVVDNDLPITEFIADALTDEGYTVRTALTAIDARALIADQRPDLVLLDLHMPGMSGAELVNELKDAGLAAMPIVLMTADALAPELSMDSVVYCLLKPFDLDDLIDCV